MSRSRTRALLVLGVLIAGVALLPRTSSSAYGGSLLRDQPWILRITPGVTGLGAMAVTVLGVTDSAVQVMDLFTTSLGAPDVSGTYGPLPRRIKRVSISVAAITETETYEIQVIQGSSIRTFDAIGDIAVVFDIVP